MRFVRFGLSLSLTLLGAWVADARADQKPSWPELRQWRNQGGGGRDAAVIAAVESYTHVPPVPGARANAEGWFDYFTRSRGLAVDRVRLLRDGNVTVGKLRKHLKLAAQLVGERGTLWFVFVGHGAPSRDGKDGMLVTVDARQDPDSLYEQSLSRSAAMLLLSGSRAGRIVAVLDTCFSGRTGTGKALVPGLQPLVVESAPAGRGDPRAVVLTAAAGDEFAGALPGISRPAFSYLVLGGLRGWADADGNGEVTGRELAAYAQKTLRALVTDRTQTPTVTGASAAPLGSGWERGPDLVALAKLYSGGVADAAKVALPEVPAPRALAGGALALRADVGVLEAYDRALNAEERGGAATKARAWRALAEMGGRNPYRGEAAARARTWEDYLRRKPARDAYRAAVRAQRSGTTAQRRLAWARLAKIEVENPWREKARERAAAWAAYEEREKALQARGIEAVEKLRRVLRLRSVPQAEKEALAASLRSRFGGLASVTQALEAALAGAAAERGAMVRIPGGSFRMGVRGDAVIVGTFEMDRTEVTVAQYRTCVAAGKCDEPGSKDSMGMCNWGAKGREKHPINCVDWHGAKAFCAWAGKRLPTEEEWEWAARGGKKGRTYPWGEAPPGPRLVNACGTECVAWWKQWWKQRKKHSGAGKPIYAGDDGWAHTSPVGSYPDGRSAHGLLDMAGNVEEWTSSKWGPQPVIRGGEFTCRDAKYLRSASRNADNEDKGTALYGFRCARTP